MSDIIDKEILVKAREGDLEAFEAVYRAASGFVYNVAHGVVHNSHDAEEVTQEVFLNIYHKLRAFRMESSFKTWVYRITINFAINRYKKTSRERQKNHEYYENMDDCYEPKEAGMDIEYTKRTVDSLLSRLNADQKTCVVLREIEGLSYEEIADTMNIGINTVRSRLKRARVKLLTMRKGGVKNEM